jgi:hypothetical protein
MARLIVLIVLLCSLSVVSARVLLGVRGPPPEPHPARATPVSDSLCDAQRAAVPCDTWRARRLPVACACAVRVGYQRRVEHGEMFYMARPLHTVQPPANGRGHVNGGVVVGRVHRRSRETCE